MAAKQTFENALKKLEQIVEELETGELSLDKALKKFEEGMDLSKFCRTTLEETEKKISLLMADRNGWVTERPFPGNDSDDA